MSSATLNLHVKPFRLFTKSEAAHYCRCPAKKFDAVCPVRPVDIPCVGQLYDVNDLDRWIEGLKAGDSAAADDIVSRLG